MWAAAWFFGLQRDTVRKMLACSLPSDYRRCSPPKRLNLSLYAGVIDRILKVDTTRPRKGATPSSITTTLLQFSTFFTVNCFVAGKGAKLSARL